MSDTPSIPSKDEMLAVMLDNSRDNAGKQVERAFAERGVKILRPSPFQFADKPASERGNRADRTL
jgi:hypothetical protein